MRIALLFSTGDPPARAAPLFRQLTASAAATTVLLVRYRPTEPRRRNWAFALYGVLDNRLESRQLPSIDRPFDAAVDCPGARLIECEGVASPSGAIELPAAVVSELHQARLDAIIALDRSGWRGAILSAARHGLWSYSWNGQGTERLDAALLQALRSERVFMRCELRRSATQDTAGATQTPIAITEISGHWLSLAIARGRAYSAAAVLAPRALRRLQQGESQPAIQPAEPREQAAMPGSSGILCLAARLALRWFRLRRRSEWWFLAVRPHSEATQVMPSTADFRPLPAARGHYYADPFLIEKDGATHLFFEDFDVKKRRACIAHAVLAADGTPSRAAAVLERPYHLSYPFVFSWRGDIWLLPESGQNRSVDLYRCEAFPQRWSLHRTLLEGWRMVDATLHEDDGGGWWMFVQAHEHPRDAGALFLFMADTPLGPWQPHPGNPIQSDIRHARPGGRLFRREGRLLRPAQDCSQRYGGALWLMEVKELTAQRYREEPFLRLDPLDLPGNFCLHHRDATDRFEFVDGMRLHPPAAAD